MQCIECIFGWLLMSLHAACSMYWQYQHVTYTGSCKSCFVHIPVFGGKKFLIFPIIDLIVDLKLSSIIDLSDPVDSLIRLFDDGAGGSEGVQLIDESNKGQVWVIRECMGQLVPQYLMLKPVNWQIYLLMWTNFVRNWTCHLQRNYTGPHSSSIEDTLGTIGSQFG